MDAERDVLNRAVFPEVRRRCQARGAEFVGLDLHWGVTEDEIRDGTLAICLQEIAQCRPFVCLLGERFGSVYPPDEVPVSIWDAEPRETALRPLVEQWYRRDDTVTPVLSQNCIEQGSRRILPCVRFSGSLRRCVAGRESRPTR